MSARTTIVPLSKALGNHGPLGNHTLYLYAMVMVLHQNHWHRLRDSLRSQQHLARDSQVFQNYRFII